MPLWLLSLCLVFRENCLSNCLFWWYHIPPEPSLSDIWFQLQWSETFLWIFEFTCMSFHFLSRNLFDTKTVHSSMFKLNLEGQDDIFKCNSYLVEDKNLVYNHSNLLFAVAFWIWDPSTIRCFEKKPPRHKLNCYPHPHLF